MKSEEVTKKAVAFFTAHDYTLITQTEGTLVFQTEKRDINWIKVLVLFCLGTIPAVIYYVSAPKHKVTVSLSGENDVKATATGNTVTANKDAKQFLATLSR